MKLASLRFPILLALALFVFDPRSGFALQRGVPQMTASDLNGRALKLPDDMVGEPAMWAVAFDRAHQSQVDRLFALFQKLQATKPNLVFWEVPVITNPGAIGRWFIDNGMRSGIPSRETRGRVVTLYVADRENWLKQMGVSGVDQTYVVMVGREGQVLAVTAQSNINTMEDLSALITKAVAPVVN
jgi:hypothetical protein